jgi:hypothetical protein
MARRLVRPAAIPLAVLVVTALGAPGQAGAAHRWHVLRYAGAGGGPDYATDVAASPGGPTLFVTGDAYGGAATGDDYTTVAYSSTGGTQLWVAAYDGPDHNIDDALAVAASTDAVFVTGNSFGGPSTTNDIATVAYDAVTGDERWVARYDGPGHDVDSGADVVVGANGDVFVAGASVGADGSLDGIVIAYDGRDGTQLWTTRVVGAAAGGADELLSIAGTGDGTRVYATGYQTGRTIDFVTVALATVDGTVLWKRTVDGGGDEIARAVDVSSDGLSVAVTGGSSGAPSTPAGSPLSCSSAGSVPTDGADYVTAAYDALTGQRRWLATYDGPDGDCDEAFDVAIDQDDDRAYVTGASFSVAGDMDVATVGYDLRSGSELWATRWDGPLHDFDAGDSLVATGGRVDVAGQTLGQNGAPDFVIQTLDGDSGGPVGLIRYDGPGGGFDAPNASAVDRSGHDLYVTGGSAGSDGVPDYATVIVPSGA